MYLKRIKIGGLFLSAEHYASEANQTVGKPLIMIGKTLEEVVYNRRHARGTLTPKGEKVVNKVKKFFKEKYDLEVELKFDKYCGCNMCPCSPGLNIYVNFKTEYHRYSRLRDIDKFMIWADGLKLKIQKPSATWELDHIREHYKTGKHGRVSRWA